MQLGWDGRVALVAAASSGLGLAVVRELGADCAHAAAATSPRLAAVREEVDAAGPGQVPATAMDVRDAEGIVRWVDEVIAELGAPGVVVLFQPDNSGAGGHRRRRSSAARRDVSPDLGR